VCVCVCVCVYVFVLVSMRDSYKQCWSVYMLDTDPFNALSICTANETKHTIRQELIAKRMAEMPQREEEYYKVSLPPSSPCNSLPLQPLLLTTSMCLSVCLSPHPHLVSTTHHYMTTTPLLYHSNFEPRGLQRLRQWTKSNLLVSVLKPRRMASRRTCCIFFWIIFFFICVCF
jgi:hypothetical protein